MAKAKAMWIPGHWERPEVVSGLPREAPGAEQTGRRLDE